MKMINSKCYGNGSELKLYSSYYHGKYAQLIKFYDSIDKIHSIKYHLSNYTNRFSTQLSQFNNNKNQDIKNIIQELDNFLEKMKVFNYINTNIPEEYIPYIAKLCKTTKLNNKFYKYGQNTNQTNRSELAT